MKQSECPVCGRDVLADFPGLRAVCPQCEKKLALKDELVDLRMNLANAEMQANKVIGLLPTKYGLPCKVRWHIREADDELCEIARKMGLDKLDLVKPRRLDYSERVNK